MYEQSTRTDKPPGKLHSHAKFAAMNAQMDHGVGVLLNKLKELGLEDKTLVLFTSDNGGLPKSPQTPLRGFKGMYYEGGVRVPMIARWPGVIKPGSRCDVPVINVDFYPTFLDVAGAQAPAAKRPDGEILLEPSAGEPALAGLVLVRQRPGTAKGVIFATLEDETGVVNVIVWPDVFARQRKVLLGARLLGVEGPLQREGLVIHVIAKRLVDLSPRLAQLSAPGAPAIYPSRNFR